MPNKKIDSPVSDLPKLSAPAHRVLAGAGCANLKQVSKRSEAELKQLHGMGPKAIEELRQSLAAKGMAFAPEKKKK